MGDKRPAAGATRVEFGTQVTKEEEDRAIAIVHRRRARESLRMMRRHCSDAMEGMTSACQERDEVGQRATPFPVEVVLTR